MDPTDKSNLFIKAARGFTFNSFSKILYAIQIVPMNIAVNVKHNFILLSL